MVRKRSAHTHAHDHADAQTDAHAHAHADAQAHAHAHADAHASAPLARGAGVGNVVFFDAPSGLAGDMTIAALADLGVPREVVETAVDAVGLAGAHVHWGTCTRHGVVAVSFDVHVRKPQPERGYRQVRALLDGSRLSEGTLARAQRTFLRLAEAEAKVHRTSTDDVHFHEVGAVDAIVDVVGSAAALDYLGGELVVSPLPMGRGFVKAAHGTLPLPAPATVECLVGIETYDAGLDIELVTPTGAAIVGAHATRCERWPAMTPLRTGFGAGARDLEDRANLLRVVLGTPAIGARSGTHVVLECNLDDATGELVAGAIESLLGSGALDAWATPVTMKKGRPGLLLSVLATRERADALAVTILRETTSLGVRRHAVDRTERPRHEALVQTPFGPIPVKVSGGPYGPPQIKPEWNACAAAARAHGVPVREVIRAALVAAADV